MGFPKSGGLVGTQWEKFSVVQSINNDTLTALTSWEAAGDFSLIPLTFVPATGQLTLPPGTYLYAVQAQFADPGAASVGYRQIGDGFGFTLMQVPIGAAQAPTKLEATGMGQLTTQITAAALQVRQTQGVALNVTFAMFDVFRLR